MTPRHFSLLAAAGLAALGVAAGGASLAAGLFDQAIAFVWPSLAAAVALALFAPGDARD